MQDVTLAVPEKLLQQLIDNLSTVGLRLVYAILILVIGLFLAKHLSRIIIHNRLFTKLDQGLQTFLASFIRLALKILVILIAAGVLGIPMASFVAILASCGLAIGAALQGSLSNLAGGIMILLFKPFSIGDYIQAGENEGTVQSISILYTVLEMLDKRRVTLPNGALTNAAVVNYTAAAERRVDLEVTVDSDADLEQVKALLLGTCQAHEKVLKKPPAVCRLLRHGDNGLVFTLRAWCRPADYWDVYFDLTEAVELALRRAKIPVPFQTVTVLQETP